jgi:prepilin-type N-terminal cleavage/methylation domain-containing protein
MKRLTKKGFTLVEVLAAIFIICLVLGIGGFTFIQIMNNSKEKSYELTLNNVKKAANTYVQEFPDDISWEAKNNNKSSCIPIIQLVNKSNLKKDIFDNHSDLKDDFVIVTKDNNNVIISEEIDTNGAKCLDRDEFVNIPSSKDICNDLTYNGNPQKLIQDNIDTTKFSLEYNDELGVEDIVYSNGAFTATNAGTHEFKLSLKKDTFGKMVLILPKQLYVKLKKLISK